MRLSTTSGDELLDGEADVLGNLAQEGGRDIAALVNRDCRDPPVGVTELLVGAPLPDLSKAESLKQANDFPRLEDWRLGQLSDCDRLNAHELRFKLRRPVLEEKRDDLSEVALELVERLRLAVSARKTGHVPDVQARVGVPLNDRCKSLHRSNDTGAAEIVPAAA